MRSVRSTKSLSFIDIGPGQDVYEYSVLATSLIEDLASFGQLYRDRGDGENILALFTLVSENWYSRVQTGRFRDG